MLARFRYRTARLELGCPAAWGGQWFRSSYLLFRSTACIQMYNSGILSSMAYSIPSSPLAGFSHGLTVTKPYRRHGKRVLIAYLDVFFFWMSYFTSS